MPSRWFVPVPGLDPGRVRLEWVHAQFSRWFDASAADHAANDKPYRISPPTVDTTGAPGVEIATLTDSAQVQLLAAATPGASVRLGNQIRRVGRPRRLAAASWAQLAADRNDHRWELELVTPTTFRTGDRSSPLPRTDTILDGLHRVWRTWSDLDPGCTERDWAAVWVSDLDLRSSTLEVLVRRRDGSAQPIVVSGVTGSLALRCEDPDVARRVGPLLRLTDFCGLGGMTLKGLGVTRVRSLPRRGERPGGEAARGALG